jgi:hypothetical protein
MQTFYLLKTKCWGSESSEGPDQLACNSKGTLFGRGCPHRTNKHSQNNYGTAPHQRVFGHNKNAPGSLGGGVNVCRLLATEGRKGARSVRGFFTESG